MSRPRRNRDQENRITQEIIRNSEVILSKADVEKFIQYSEEFGKLCQQKGVSTTQIRGIYQKVKQLPPKFEESKIRLNLLRPKLAYQKGRFNNLTDLQAVLDHLIKNVRSDSDLTNFKEFFEAIICYHRAYGGKE